MLTSRELYESHQRLYPNQPLLSSTFSKVLKQMIDLSYLVSSHEKRKEIIAEALHQKVDEQTEMTKETAEQLHLLICIQIDEYYDHHSYCCLLS